MKRMVISFLLMIVLTWATVTVATEDVEVKGRQLISQKPPFTLTFPSELRLVHSFSQEYPKENSLTRGYFFIKEENKQIEDLLILQIADRTNPQAEPIRIPPLKPYTEKRMYFKDRKRKGDLESEVLIQLLKWNPKASSLQSILKKGFILPSHWAMQGQFLFNYLGEHAVFIRYSKDVNTFGLNVSKTGDVWNSGSISGSEKRVYEAFKKNFLEMVDSIQIKSY
jgi:hypothetical protein